MDKRIVLGGVAVTVVAALSVAGFFWNEARKEVVFLCGNFRPGITEDSVIRQLNTGHFLRYEHTSQTSTNYIYVDTPYTFGRHTCEIETNEHQIVVNVESKPPRD